ncbi:MAG: right-handed parallel beta-helix repeat-containing protein, partial [Acidimicrobiales bacterium]
MAAAAGVTVAAASIISGVLAPAAHATGPEPVSITSCGQSVASDAVLVKTLTCPGEGVIITGAGVTLDLGGHALRSSTGTGGGVVIAGPSGSTATVRGPGKVKGFLRGIDDVPRSDTTGSPTTTPTTPTPTTATTSFRHHVIVDGVVLLDNTWGIQVIEDLTDVSGTTIRGTNGIGGVDCTGSCASGGVVNLTSSAVTASGLALVAVSPSSQVQISHSHLGGGIDLGTSSGFDAADSTFKDARISVSDAGMSIERSRLVDTSVSLDSTSGGTFTDNLVRSTKGGTAFDVGGSGVFRSVFEGNRFTGWDDAIVTDPATFQVEVTGNRFEGNVTGVRTGVGTFPCADGSAGALRSNRFVRNSGDAVVLSCGQWAVGGNQLLFNGGLGIDASGPLVQVTDEGGNVALGNAPPQCVGVVCLPP